MQFGIRSRRGNPLVASRAMAQNPVNPDAIAALQGEVGDAPSRERRLGMDSQKRQGLADAVVIPELED